MRMFVRWYLILVIGGIGLLAFLTFDRLTQDSSWTWVVGVGAAFAGAIATIAAVDGMLPTERDLVPAWCYQVAMLPLFSGATAALFILNSWQAWVAFVLIAAGFRMLLED